MQPYPDAFHPLRRAIVISIAEGRIALSRSPLQWRQKLLSCALVLLSLWTLSGCSTQKFLIRRDTPANPLTTQLQLGSKHGPQVSPRTNATLRRFAMQEIYDEDPRQCLDAMQQLLESEAEAGLVYSISEIAYVLGKRAERQNQEAQALDMYGVAVSNAYMYLFSREFDHIRNPYDPQFRGACDLYNEALESTLRLVNAKGQLKPGQCYQLTTGEETYEVHTLVRGKWREEDFERFEFVSDYEVEGLPSSGLSYGLGVPLIAVRKRGDESDKTEKYYPEGLSFPVTALLRVVKPGSMPGKGADHRHHCVLELHDPLVASNLTLAERLVPLQTDLSKSLAYFLDSPQFRQKTQATAGLLNPQKSAEHRGIFMLEPFDPERIPVIMVHGLWSSPITWMPMFNDLRSFEELRTNYQFWFYRYPTGQPFWLSATQLREDLAVMRESLDPERRYQALNHTVMVGHSMGGLVSRMQTIESDDRFWDILSDKPFEEVQGDPEVVGRLRKAAFFEPNRDIQRVITIGTPHRGSDYANDTTKWLGRQLIKLPNIMVTSGVQLISQNPGVFRNTDLLTTATSIDSLSPDSPVFPAMLRAPTAPWVRYHNIIGMVPKRTWLGTKEATGDGVVEAESARIQGAASEIVVESEHQHIHRHPKAIFEVRRILLTHLEDVRKSYRTAGQNQMPQSLTSEESSFMIPAHVVSTMVGTLNHPNPDLSQSR
ncbi:MAG: alpha/beta fold hydrolase [bacterium]|nr:alpha/beta fold hydrolase [bacterium]